MFAAPVRRVEEDGSRGIGPAEGPVVSDVGPDPTFRGLPLGQDRDRYVIALHLLAGEHVGPDEIVQRPEQGGTGADLLGERREAESRHPRGYSARSAG